MNGDVGKSRRRKPVCTRAALVLKSNSDGKAANDSGAIRLVSVEVMTISYAVS
jgi:hypothetical protein